MKSNELGDISIIDFTTRLPGPLGTKVLSTLGAKVFKVESPRLGDNFNNPLVYKFNPCFKDWYQQMNEDKEIIQAEINEELLQNYPELKNVDIILIPDSKKILKQIKSLFPSCKAIIKIAGGTGEWKSLHDLNALSFAKVFSVHLKDSSKPPFLPIAGMSFGQHIATTILACYLKASKVNETIEKVLYLKEVTEEILGYFDSSSFKERPRQLHNGAFPCYNTYLTQDKKYVCLAAVEDKFWNKLRELFNLSCSEDDRFDVTGKTTKLLENTFEKLSSDVIRDIINQQDVCLTIIE